MEKEKLLSLLAAAGLSMSMNSMASALPSSSEQSIRFNNDKVISQEIEKVPHLKLNVGCDNNGACGNNGSCACSNGACGNNGSCA